MTDPHSNKQRSWRPDPDEYKNGKDRLRERGHAMNAYLGAALRWLNHDPEQALAALGPYWPDTRLGRPRAQPDPATHEQACTDPADPPQRQPGSNGWAA